jgi:hypothetical protein
MTNLVFCILLSDLYRIRRVFFSKILFSCLLKIGIGMITELLSLILSLLIVEFFRRIRSRQQISPVRQALNMIKPSIEMLVYI